MGTTSERYWLQDLNLHGFAGCRCGLLNHCTRCPYLGYIECLEAAKEGLEVEGITHRLLEAVPEKKVERDTLLE